MNIELASVLLTDRWKSAWMPMQNGAEATAAKGGMARRAADPVRNSRIAESPVAAYTVG